MVFAICEDESIQRNTLKEYVEKLMIEMAAHSKVLLYESGEQLLNNYPTEAEVIFLDIQMGTISGMQVAKEIRKFNEDVEIVFVTGDPEYMQMGYEVNARRYLLKPLSYQKFGEQIKPCIEKIAQKSNRYIWIKSEYSDYRIKVSDIQYAEKVGRRLKVCTIAREYDTYMSMKELEDKVKGEVFVRCHKSYLINLMAVSGLHKEGILIAGQTIPVRRQAMKDLKKQLVEVLGEQLC